ncbi:MAG TPA: hypothetical protein VKA53_03770 [Thermoanaerobaculia bacterium]|nr:hypothetical protein [Thermoanaerobaculia bacterium]
MDSAKEDVGPERSQVPGSADSPRVVAYVGILGFLDIVRASPGSGDEERRARMLKALRYVKAHAELAGMGLLGSGECPSDLQATAFLDCMVISDRADAAGASRVLAEASLLSGWLLRDGILSRGGVAVGPTHHDARRLFGEGLLSAYGLERQQAVYPRIVVAEELVDLFEFSPFFRLLHDHDGFWFLDLFFQLQTSRSLAEFSLARDIEPPRWDRDAFLHVRQLICGHLERLQSGARPRPRRVEKYIWLAGRFNEAIVEDCVSGVEPIIV